MHTMKVLTITLLACAVTVIQPVEAQFTVDFAQPRYAIAENNTLTVEVRTNLEEFPLDFEFEFSVIVRVKEDLQCTPLSDIRLLNGSTVTLTFSRKLSTATFDVEFICDGIVELDQRCTLDFDPPNSRFVTQGGPAEVEIAECEDDYIECKWNTTLVEVTEGKGVEVKLFSSCSRRQYSGVIPINVICVPNLVPGFFTAAFEGSDWKIVGPTTLHFTGSTTFDPETDMFADEPIVISIINDECAEPIDSLICSLLIGVVQSVRTVDPKQVTIVINDDDVTTCGSCPVTCGFSQNVTVPEGSPAVLQIICNQAPDTDITFSVTTMDNTANSPSDYLGGTYSVTIPAGSSMANLAVRAIKTDTVEVDEFFKATLTIPRGSDTVVVGIDTAYVTITDTSVAGSWSPWLKGSCSTLPCGGVGVRTDVRLCTSPTPNDGRVPVQCKGEQWRNTSCFACPCGGGWSSWSEGVCSESRQGQRVRGDSRICTTPDHPECCPGLPTRTSPCPESAVHGGWSAWSVGYCSKPCGGSGVRTDWRACNNPPPLLGGDHCHGPASRTMPCYTCPCGGGWSNWVEGTCSKTCGLGTRLDRRRCTTADHQECCPGCGLRQSNCSVAECPVHGGWSSWLEVTSCSVSCGGGRKFLVRECNEPVPAHGGKDCDGVPYRVERCNTCPCDAGWSSWVPGACGAPCGQNGTAIATRKCRGPSECCPGEGKRTEVCTSPPCQGR